MVLAGLIETTKIKTRKGVPFLCNVPVSGLLFGVTSYKEEEINLIIFVTYKVNKMIKNHGQVLPEFVLVLGPVDTNVIKSQ
jgi:type II secretory pathway component GspD/PulD (secretin)